MGDDAPAFAWPKWFTPSAMTRAHSARVARGLHPFGLELGPDGSTCGACAHLRKRSLGKTYYKCALAKDTPGPATDVRLRWRWCSAFEDRSAP